MVDFGTAERPFRNQIGSGETANHIAQFVRLFPQEISGFFPMNFDGVRLTRVIGSKVGRQFLDLDLD